jgi:hypothetical protein
MRISAVLLAVSLSASIVEGQTIGVAPGAQSMPLRVFDSNGKLVGGTVAEPQWPDVPQLVITLRYQPPSDDKVPTIPDTFTLRIQPEQSLPKFRYRWSQLDTDVFFFETSDCTGQAYVEAGNPMPGRRMALLDTQTNLLYLSAPDPDIVLKSFHSFRVPLQSCSVQTGSMLSVAVDPVIDMDTVFAPTFEVR